MSKFAFNKLNLYMKRAPFVIVCLLLILCSCSKDKGYVVEGKIKGLNGNPVYVVLESPQGLKMDTVWAVKDYFRLEGNADETSSLQLYYADRSEFLRLYVRDGDRIELKGDASHPFAIGVRGSDLNEDLGKFYNNNSDLLEKLNATYRNGTTQTDSKKAQQLTATLNKQVLDFIDSHKKSDVSPLLVRDYLFAPDNYEQCDSVLKVLDVGNKPSFLLKPLLSAIETARKGEIGKAVGFFSFTDNDGSLMTNVSCKGTPVLLLFWSAEDSVSSAENKAIRQIYKSYDTKKIRLISISLDREDSLWRSHLKTDSLKWSQVRLAQGMSHEFVRSLGVGRVPFTIVVNEKGKIAARDIYGTQLKEYIVGLMKAPKDSIVNN